MPQTKIGALNSANSLVNNDLPTVDVAHGGTGLVTIAANSLLYTSALDTVTALAPGSNGQVLTIVAGVPTYVTASGGTISGSGTLNFVPKFTPDGVTLGNSVIFNSGANVGIGNVIPAFPLDVTGGISASLGYYIGSNLMFHTTNGTSNVFSGFRAGLNATGAGTNNAGFGSDALAGVTTGSELTAIGQGALQHQTGGGNCVAVGRMALNTSTTSLSNVAVGLNALKTLLNTNQNTAIGEQAGEVTIAARNTFLGFRAGHLSSVDNDSIAIGASAAITASNQLIIGSATSPIINAYIGSAATPTGANVNLYVGTIGAGAAADPTSRITLTPVGSINTGIYIPMGAVGGGYGLDITGSNASMISASISNSGVGGTAIRVDNGYVQLGGNTSINVAISSSISLKVDSTPSTDQVAMFKGSNTSGTQYGLNLVMNTAGTQTQYGLYVNVTAGTTNYALFMVAGKVNANNLPTGNAGLSSGDLYVDTAANILANTDLIIARKT